MYWVSKDTKEDLINILKSNKTLSRPKTIQTAAKIKNDDAHKNWQP